MLFRQENGKRNHCSYVKNIITVVCLNSTVYYRYMITCRYYEFEVLVPGKMKVGWAKMSLESGKELGTDGNSFVFDGFTVSIRLSLYVLLFSTEFITSVTVSVGLIWLQFRSNHFRVGNGTKDQKFTAKFGRKVISLVACLISRTTPSVSISTWVD